MAIGDIGEAMFKCEYTEDSHNTIKVSGFLISISLYFSLFLLLNIVFNFHSYPPRPITHNPSQVEQKLLAAAERTLGTALDKDNWRQFEMKSLEHKYKVRFAILKPHRCPAVPLRSDH